jgi:tetratricopeptide (TPR) repeat protein
MRQAALLALALTLPTLAAHAQDALLLQARTLMERGQPRQAYELLEPAEGQRAADAPYNYLLGIAALDAGEVTRAIFALERAVDMRPDDNLARAELARAYLAAGEPAAARQELQTARRGAMPAQAAAAIDRVLGALAQDPAPGRAGPWRGYLEAFAGHDSNVNSATAAGQFALPAFGGIVFNLDQANQQRSDTFIGAAAGLGLQQPLAPGWQLQGHLNARDVHHRRSSTQDNRQLDGSLGLAWQQGANLLSLAGQANTYDIDSARYRRAAGLSGLWQHTLGPASQLSAFSQWSRLHYRADPGRDADRLVLGGGYARAFAGGARVAYGSVYGARENARQPGAEQYGHRALGVRLGAEARWGEAATVFSAVQFERRHYGGTEPFFDMPRRDRQLDLTLGVHLEPAPQWRITPQFSYLRAASNVVLYTYRRAVWQISVRREFK